MLFSQREKLFYTHPCHTPRAATIHHYIRIWKYERETTRCAIVEKQTFLPSLHFGWMLTNVFSFFFHFILRKVWKLLLGLAISMISFFCVQCFFVFIFFGGVCLSLLGLRNVEIIFKHTKVQNPSYTLTFCMRKCLLETEICKIGMEENASIVIFHLEANIFVLLMNIYREGCFLENDNLFACPAIIITISS